MQGNVKRQVGSGSRSQIADLRAGFRAESEKSKPPKPPRPIKRESDDERAEKAEKKAQAQHSTSLLTGKINKPYVRKWERDQRKGGGLFFQLLLVVLVVGGVAYALEPSLLPPEWTAKAHEFVTHYIKI